MLKLWLLYVSLYARAPAPLRFFQQKQNRRVATVRAAALEIFNPVTLVKLCNQTLDFICKFIFQIIIYSLTTSTKTNNSVQQQQGGWKSLNGMLSYSHSSLSHASHVADLIHDASLVPVSVTQFTHNTFSPSPTAASSQPRLPAPITTPAPPTTGQPSC